MKRRRIDPEDSFRRAGKHSQDTLEQAEQRRANAATSRANRHAIRAGDQPMPLPFDIGPTPSPEVATRERHGRPLRRWPTRLRERYAYEIAPMRWPPMRPPTPLYGVHTL